MQIQNFSLFFNEYFERFIFFCINIFFDESLNRFKNLYAAAGHPNCIFKINFDELLNLTNGTVKDIVE